MLERLFERNSKGKQMLPLKKQEIRYKYYAISELPRCVATFPIKSKK